ncbi:hypothetical protein GTY65_30680 [Streptomyces sp. SID8379]|uniref:hypothetical protein n=1 Tax=unclassified Streptomyces TaxID=2593676 RepID=UPI00131A4723|nr:MULTISPECIES: hypothetical protein [unclassified Streptomyces]MYW68408.1 hypothetical protein [Streptomyces sp. SID8379]
MATEDLSFALPSPAHPMASPGYGKRGTPDQGPLRRDSFAHLPLRARYLAGFIDALPEHAAIDAKTLAKAQPLYGQAAVRSALNELSAAGHLRRVRRLRDLGTGNGTTRWVFHTYWSRIARGDDWWARFLDGDVPELEQEAPERPRTRSDAYHRLAQLGLREPRLTLSAADCATLEAAAAEWLAREPDPQVFTRAMTTGLPAVVHSPRAFLAGRLRDKLPPQRIPVTRTQAPAPRTLMECTDCGRPGRAEALPGGLCRGCRGSG